MGTVEVEGKAGVRWIAREGKTKKRAQMTG